MRQKMAQAVACDRLRGAVFPVRLLRIVLLSLVVGPAMGRAFPLAVMRLGVAASAELRRSGEKVAP